ncbi:SDR family oxidoreductase [Rathayibacter festucae]|uniref:Short-chain dehydrogenase/reductase n=1 Tax=Rathayibacter festucae DSM 15932 TaxID=1328866 RepID=A0A3Q9UY30_9MICO|nr:SDR family oxidoreductase [Rathayibacter festucae]AZZ51890.1 short-chain dehydrogenase/reductase [Rathayibacter festucae DSM 15932]
MTTWLITGTSSGFGRHLTEILLERGDTVAATLRSPSRLDDLAEVHGDRLWRRSLDVTDAARTRAVVDEAFAELGTIDVVVSNAGYGLFGAAEELSDEQIDRQLATNVTGAITLVRAVVPHLRAQGGGRILQVASMGGQLAFPGMSLYHASKWALEGFFEALSPEMAPFGISTTLIEPGMSRTGFGGASADVAPPLDSYAGTPAADFVRGHLPLEAMPGDPRKMAAAMIAVAELADPPLRQALGSDADAMIRATLLARLSAMDVHRDIALSTDADDYVAAPAH